MGPQKKARGFAQGLRLSTLSDSILGQGKNISRIIVSYQEKQKKQIIRCEVHIALGAAGGQ